MPTCAAFVTAPMPVTTPHPKSAACHNGTSGGMTTAPAIGTTACSAKQATIRPCWRMLPSGLRRREDPSIRVPASAAAPAGWHRFRLPLRHARQLPQDGTKQNATWSPGEIPLTSAPIAVTTPAPSWPSTIGQRPRPRLPSARCTSE